MPARQVPGRVSAVVTACLGVMTMHGAVHGQTELSLQETELNVTADHSGNITVYLTLDSVGPNGAVYGIVGQPATSPAPQFAAGPARAGGPGAMIVPPTASSAWAAPHAANQLIVCYTREWADRAKGRRPDPALRQRKDALHTKLHTALKRELPLINADLVEVPAGADLRALAARYRARPGVASVQPNFTYRAIGLPDDPNFPFVPSSLGAPDDQILWGLHTTLQDGAPIPSDAVFDSDIDAAEAWEITAGSPNVVVAVIDTGVDYTHPDLTANMWSNTGEIPGNGVDDDGNGYVDDIHGYDFINDDGDPYDDHYHGTHVAGTIAATGNNGLHIAGVAYGARIMALKFLGADGYGNTADAVSCVNYAVQMGARISNNSWGGGGYDAALVTAIQAAGAANHLFVAAAGNDTLNTDIYPHYPSTYDLDNIISVVSWTKNGDVSDFSNYGAVTTDLAAPGSSIWSLDVAGDLRLLSGTSMATPHVSGVAALLESLVPTAGPLQVKQWILDGVTPEGNLQGLTLTAGRLNAVEPVRLATMPWLRIENREGFIDAGETQPIQVTFVTENIPVGSYSGSLIVLDLSYDNAVTPRIEIPVSMELEFVELPPVAEDVYQYVVSNFDTPITLVGSDPNIGQTVDFTIASLPAAGQLRDPGTSQTISAAPYTLAGGVNVVTYSPAPDQVYSETFTYTTTDGTSVSSIGTVTVDVVDQPQAPQGVTAYSGNTFVDLNWLPGTEPGLIGYNVHISSDAGGPYGKVTPTPQPGTTYRHFPGGPQTIYYVITSVLDNGAESDYSAEVSGTPSYTSQYAPVNLVSTPGYEKVYLSWEPPQIFNGTYRIIRSLSGGGGALIVGELSDASATTYVDANIPQLGNGPDNGVTYDYVVENYTYWDLWGADSNMTTATPDVYTPPAAPGGLSAVGGAGFVDVTWAANAELDIDEYWVHRSVTSGGPYNYIAAVNDRRYVDAAVSPGTTYYYMVMAVDLDGDESDDSAEVAGTPLTDTDPPAAPTQLTAQGGDGYVSLDWGDNAEPDVVEYVIYRSTTQGGPYGEVDRDDPSQFLDGSVVNGTTYYYVVTAVDSSGNESAYSNEVSVTAGGCTDDADCDDGAFCNGAETCLAGACQSGQTPDCDDGVSCTNDTCNEVTDSCDHAPDDATCADGLYCNGVESCDPLGDCQPGVPVDCDDGVGCTADTCNEVTDTCDHTPDDASCNDGQFCNGAESCDPVSDCQPGTLVDCDDGVGCTTDACNEAADVCDNIPDDASCDDGLFCNGTESCNVILDCVAGNDPCSAGTICNEATDSCDPACSTHGMPCAANSDCCSNKCKNGVCRGN